MELCSTVIPEMGSSMQAESVKAHLRAAQDLLVTSLYNIAPLLDCMLANNLLSQDNYFQVRAERTPTERARKLLEVVHAQMDEQDAQSFLECLRKCESHYPRLRSWLRKKIDFTCGPTAVGVQGGPTEERLKVQFSMLCHRLGASVLPVSALLFSDGILTQFEVDQVQAEATYYQQAHKLLSICLCKGENACVRFYKALGVEDPFLAADVETPCPTVSERPKSWVSLAVEESGAAPQLDKKPSELQRYNSIDADPLANERGVLQQVTDVLDLVLDTGSQLNVCKLGVALGLRHEDVRDYFLEDVGIDDMDQISSLVTLFLEKTQDKPRLLRKLAECDIKRVQLSNRGILLLQLLREAENLIHAGSTHNSVGHIFSFLLWDSLAEAVEEPQGWTRVDPWSEMQGALQQLRSTGRADPELLTELEESCCRQETPLRLLQGVRALAQLLRDLYPLQDSLQLLESSLHQGAMVSCRPHRIQRVTRFQGLSKRVITRELGVLPPLTALPQVQYQEICQAVVRLLERAQPPEGGVTPYSNKIDLSTAQQLRIILTKATFGQEAFDSGMRHRLLGLLEFDPVTLELATLLPLHWDCFEALKDYLRAGDQHSFQLYPDGMQLLTGEGKLYLANSVAGPIAIDEGLEETFRFLTSGSTTVLIRIHCHGYKDSVYFQVYEPHCVFLSNLGMGGIAEIRDMGLEVLWAESGRVWVRQAESKGDLVTLACKHGTQVQDVGLCFLLRTQGTQCEVTFIYKCNRITAVAKRNCEVV